MMNLNEAINFAERKFKNGGGFSGVVYYISPWNNGYIIHPESYIKRNPETIIVYDTKSKKIKKLWIKN